ncbi:MAG: two-component regulator propeller domain-containing protein, partial [Candidatus Latescibacterota bacterium]
MIRRFLLVSALSFLVMAKFGINSAYAVSYPDWEGYAPMYNVQDVVEFKGNIYGAAPAGLFRYNPETLQYTLYYKNHGLETGNVQCLGVSPSYLYIGFVSGGLWRFDPQNAQFDPILFPEYEPNKISVQYIYAKNDSVLYVGHSNGVDILNLGTGELRTIKQFGNIPLGTAVKEIKVINNKIWVCTENGLAVADENNPNIDDKSSWKTYTYNSGGFTSIMNIKELSGETIYLGTIKYGLIAFNEGNGAFQSTGIPGSIYKISEGLGTYLAVGSRGLYIKIGLLWYQKDNTKFISLFSNGEKAWLGTEDDGIKCYADTGFVEIEPVPGPRSGKFTKIQITDANVVWASTSIGEGIDLLHRLQNDIWTTYGQSDGFKRTPNAVALDNNENVWLSDWGNVKSGVFVIQDNGTPEKTDDKVIPLDPDHTIIKDTINIGYCACSDITRDKHGNIWVANLQLNQPDAEEPNSHNLEPIPSSGAVVFDGYPFTKYEHYSPLDGDIPTAKIYKICADDDGWVWLGTVTKGIMALYIGDDPFDKS